MIRGILAALQLWVAPLLAGFFTLGSALVALAEHDDSGVPRMLAPPSGGPVEGPMTPARSLHVVHLALLALAAALAGTALAWWAWPAGAAVARFFIAVVLVWILGELAPRLWAANEPGLIRFEGKFVQHTLTVFRPLLIAVAWVDRGFRRRRVMAPALSDAPGSGPIERDMLSGLLGLSDMTVGDIMTPRLDIVSADFSAPREQVVETFRRAEHSRLLVVDGDPDSVTGVLYAKDLLPGLGDPGPPDWHPLIRPVGFVPEGKTLDRQLRDFQLSASHLVVVVDEFGGTSGIVTLEDVLEQIVGEIRDEYDTEEAAPLQRLEDGGWLVDGSATLAELEAELDHGFEREDVSTVGGLVLAEFGRVPKTGEAVLVDGFRLMVDQIVRRRIRRVTVRRVTKPAAVAAAPAGPNQRSDAV